jgi:hypothetical protein
MFVSYSVANPLTTVRVARHLPRPGEVMVRSGESVEPMHIVAQVVELPEFRIVNVAQEMDVPTKKAGSYLKVKRGDEITEGSVLAARGGLSGRVCRSPIAGTVVGVGRGRLLLEAEPQVLRVRALVPGYVVEVHLEEGVLIETVGSHIQAAWGNGAEAYGVLKVIVRAPRHPIRAKSVNASSQGAILVGGSTVDEETIDEAVEMQVRGIIVGSVPPTLIPKLREVDFPVVATEGVGNLPMSDAIFELLRSVDGREAAVSGILGGRWSAARPYIVVPMPTQSAQTIDADVPLGVGDRVRILRGEYRGQSGTIAELPKKLVQLETGARLPGAVIRLSGEELVKMPKVNFERLL